MIHCSEVRRLETRLLALDLPAADEAEVRAHLTDCAECRERVITAEPAMLLALAVGGEPEPEDDRFVDDVMAGVRQRRVEVRAAHRRRSWLAAAAALLLVAAAVVGLRGRGPAVVASVPAHPAVMESASVEVEGEGVRLYQLSSDPTAEVQVALIIDPRLEL